MTARMTIQLTHDQRLKLEAYRRQHGLRSLNAAVAQLVDRSTVKDTVS